MRSKLIALAGATLLLAGACSGDDDDSIANRDTFMSQCTQASEGAGLGDAGEYCGCIYDGLESSGVSADELEQAFSAGATDVPDEFTSVVTECATSAISLPTTVAP